MAAATTELPAFQFTDNDALYIASDRREQPEWSPAALQIGRLPGCATSCNENSESQASVP